MGYDVSTRKFGDGYTFWKVHAVAGDCAASPFDGENDLITMVTQAAAAGASLGGNSEGSELNVAVESVEDEITQEMFPVQNVPIAGKGTFKVIMSLGDAVKLAIAAGLVAASSEADILGSGKDADTVLIGVRTPAILTLLYRVINPHEADKPYYDYVYLPRVQVDPSLLLEFKKKDVRTAETIFNLEPSHQDGTVSGATTSQDLKMPNGSGAVAKAYYQTSIT